MLRPFTSLLLFFSLLSLSLQASPTKRFPHASSESDFSERANPETLRKYVFDLSAPSMKGRLTGSPLGKAAEEYVKNVMESLNLSVTVQSFSFPLYEVVAPVSLTVKEGVPGSEARSFVYLKDFREVDYTGFGKTSGELVFVGYGMDAPTSSSDLKGKIALLLTGVPQGADAKSGALGLKVHNLALRGASGILVVPTGKLAERIAEGKEEAELRAMDFKSGFLQELYHPKVPVFFIHSHVTEELTGKNPATLAAAPEPKSLNKWISLELHGKMTPQAQAKNILAVLPGTDPLLKDEVIVVGAHYDHLGIGADGEVFPGAADNAAGSAVVMEAARLFASSGIKPKRTVLFALWGAEEQGLYGSTFYVKKSPLFPLERTKMMVQLDYLDGQEGPFLTNVDDNPLVQLFIGDSVKEKRLQILDYKGQCASDDCPFLERKVPAYRFVAFGEHHHRRSDTRENLSLEMLQKTADIVVQGFKAAAY